MSDKLNDLVNDLEADYLNAADDALHKLAQRAKEIQMRLRRREEVKDEELLELASLSGEAVGALKFRGWAKATLRSYQGD